MPIVGIESTKSRRLKQPPVYGVCNQGLSMAYVAYGSWVMSFV